jgi:hypothetical protein
MAATSLGALGGIGDEEADPSGPNERLVGDEFEA